MKVSVFQGKDGQWYFSLVAPNGETIATSEGHKNRVDVLELVAKYFSTWKVEALGY